LIGVVVGTFGCPPPTLREDQTEDAVGWEQAMKKRARQLLTQSLCAVFGLSVVFAASPSWSADPLAGVIPLDPSALSGAVTNNFSNSLISAQTSSNSGSVSNTKINLGGGTLTNGDINGNSVSSNQGLTSVMMNTGNNVNFNNAFIINITIPSATH
jgi:hypothetical protein